MKGTKASANCREGQAAFFVLLLKLIRKQNVLMMHHFLKGMKENRNDYTKDWFCSASYCYALCMVVYGKLILF